MVGIPLLKYLNRSDDETEEVTKEITLDTPKKVHNDTAHHTMYIRNLIAKSLAISNSAFKSSRLKLWIQNGKFYGMWDFSDNPTYLLR